MTYKALYRKYRPVTFNDVVGQQAIVKTLKNAVNNNKLSHAYLFCGPRGTGKTSVAKLLAKTINCTGEGEKPCGKCPNCLDIQESSHPDVVEMDAATNNGVDEIRELIEKVKYAPMQGKYKVYIIDEVHMITNNAFNALLKTLEEPPEYCIFILCTTEPHKILPTIVSRCQRFDFNKISVQVIKGRLKYIVDQEKISCDDKALQLIADLAEGGMRDALSILDQCIAYKENNLTAEDVGNVYGIATPEEKIRLLENVKNSDVKNTMLMVNEFVSRGIDIQRATLDLVNMIKETVIYKLSEDNTLLQNISEVYARKLGSLFSTKELLQFADNLMETLGKYNYSSDVLSVFEVCLLKMMDISQNETVGASPSLNDSAPQIPEIVPVASGKNEIGQKPEYRQAEIFEKKDLSDEEFYAILKAARKAVKEKNAALWNNVKRCREEQYMAVTSYLGNGEIMAESETDMIVVVNDRVTADYLNELSNNKKLEKLVEEKYGTHKNVTAITGDQKTYLINYFRSRKMIESEEVPRQEGNPEEKKDEVIEKLDTLFGKGGYNIVEE